MNKKTLYAFIASFILLIAVIVLNRYTFSQMRRFYADVDHTRVVITTFESLSNNFKSAQLYTPANDTGMLRPFFDAYKSDADSIHSELKALKTLTQDNPAQAARVERIDVGVSNQFDLLMHFSIASMIDSGQGWRLNQILRIHQWIDQGIAHEETLLAGRKAELDRSTHLINVLTTCFGVIAVAIIFLTFITNFFATRQRQWLEGFLESILNTSQNGVVHYRAIRDYGRIVDFRIEYINTAIEKQLELNASGLTGKRLSEVPSYMRMPNTMMQHYIQVVESGQPETFESYYERDHVKRWFLVSLARMRDGVTASFHDITRIKQYEDELKANISDLERSNTELEQYAYVASHDLQEPLRKIRSFGSYLQDTQAAKMDEKGRAQLEKIIRSAERMSILIKDILGYSSLKRDGMLEMVDLNQVLQSVLQDLDLMLTQKKAEVKSDRLPSIEAIPLQMIQLFYNLLNNSLKFVKSEGRPLIQVRCRKLREHQKPDGLIPDLDYYEIVFQDNGIGFSQEYGEHIFGMFKRLNDRQSYPGSGIGLALCKKVVDNHHGTIIANGVENEGAAFYVYLPEKQPGINQKKA